MGGSHLGIPGLVHVARLTRGPSGVLRDLVTDA